MFSYGNKDRCPLENVKFYQKDKSVELRPDEVNTLGHMGNSTDLPVRRRLLCMRRPYLELNIS